jgi:hypothetical protein
VRHWGIYRKGFCIGPILVSNDFAHLISDAGNWWGIFEGIGKVPPDTNRLEGRFVWKANPRVFQRMVIFTTSRLEMPVLLRSRCHHFEIQHKVWKILTNFCKQWILKTDIWRADCLSRPGGTRWRAFGSGSMARLGASSWRAGLSCSSMNDTLARMVCSCCLGTCETKPFDGSTQVSLQCNVRRRIH